MTCFHGHRTCLKTAESPVKKKRTETGANLSLSYWFAPTLYMYELSTVYGFPLGLAIISPTLILNQFYIRENRDSSRFFSTFSPYHLINDTNIRLDNSHYLITYIGIHIVRNRYSKISIHNHFNS